VVHRFPEDYDELLAKLGTLSHTWASRYPYLLDHQLAPCTDALEELLRRRISDCHAEAQPEARAGLAEALRLTPEVIETVARSAFFLGFHYIATRKMRSPTSADIGRTPISHLVPPAARETLTFLNHGLTQVLTPLMVTWSGTSAGKARPVESSRDELFDAIVQCTGASFIEGAWEASVTSRGK
jgi:hypothetical protein